MEMSEKQVDLGEGELESIDIIGLCLGRYKSGRDLKKEGNRALERRGGTTD